MKITGVKAIQLKYPYQAFIADGCTPCFARAALLVWVDTDAGIYGIGESATFGGSLEAMSKIIETQLAPLVIGENPLEIEALWQRLQWNNWACGRKGMVMGAISGIDIALWDIMGKAANMPLYQLLGGNSETVAGYASAGFYAPDKSIDDLKREIEGYLKRGYSAFKMKVGRTKENPLSPLRYMRKGEYTLSFEEDMKRIAAAREVIGPRNQLMLDMNCTWTADKTLACEELFDKYQIYWIEEPLRTDNMEGYIKITKSLKKVLVAGSESEQGLAWFKEFLENGALDVVQANLGWAGGFTEGRRIAALSIAYHKIFAPHTFFSAVLTAANVHFAASLPNVPFIESEENKNPLRTELLKTPLERDEKMNYIVPQKPGLGIELNWDTVEKYKV